jgi:hypothetical protein
VVVEPLFANTNESICKYSVNTGMRFGIPFEIPTDPLSVVWKPTNLPNKGKVVPVL